MDDVGLAVDVAGFAVDFYTSGTVRDDVEFEAVFGGERYYGLVDGNPFFASVGTGASEPFEVFDAGAAGASPDEQGVLIRVINGTASHGQPHGPGSGLRHRPATRLEAPGRRPGASRFTRPAVVSEALARPRPLNFAGSGRRCRSTPSSSSRSTPSSRSGTHVRLQTLGLALMVLGVLMVAAQVARSSPVDAARPADAPATSRGAQPPPRDDLLYIAVAAVPGAIIGGRIGYWLVHLPLLGQPRRVPDIWQGGLSCRSASSAGALRAPIVARLLGAPVRRWMHALVLPCCWRWRPGRPRWRSAGRAGTPSEAPGRPRTWARGRGVARARAALAPVAALRGPGRSACWR